MKTGLKLSLLFFHCVLIASCSNESYNDFYESPFKNKKLVLEKVDEWILHSPSGVHRKIGRLRFSFVSNRDNSLFAFYDEIKRQFIITDNEGAIQSVVAGKGKGPGEIVKAGGYNFDERDRLVVFDEAQRRITVFGSDGTVIKNTEIGEGDYFMGGRWLYVQEGKIYADILDKTLLGDPREAWKSKLVGIYNYDGKLIDTIGRYDPSVKEAKMYLIFPIIHVDFENELSISAQSSGFRIQIYNLNSQKRTAWFGKKTSHFKMSNEYISPNLPRHEINEKSLAVSFPVRVHLLSKYVVLYFENLTESFFKSSDFNDKEPYISVYDNESYDCYGEVALPYILGNVSDDKFYLIENDDPDNYTLGIYEIKENS